MYFQNALLVRDLDECLASVSQMWAQGTVLVRFGDDKDIVFPNDGDPIHVPIDDNYCLRGNVVIPTAAELDELGYVQSPDGRELLPAPAGCFHSMTTPMPPGLLALSDTTKSVMPQPGTHGLPDVVTRGKTSGGPATRLTIRETCKLWGRA